eukprot:COSAG02_NODE_2205_length_9519_cov_5.690446_7_plen_150_part_00
MRCCLPDACLSVLAVAALASSKAANNCLLFLAVCKLAPVATASARGVWRALAGAQDALHLLANSQLFEARVALGVHVFEEVGALGRAHRSGTWVSVDSRGNYAVLVRRGLAMRALRGTWVAAITTASRPKLVQPFLPVAITCSGTNVVS